jgi:hypothetical protein
MPNSRTDNTMATTKTKMMKETSILMILAISDKLLNSWVLMKMVLELLKCKKECTTSNKCMNKKTWTTEREKLMPNKKIPWPWKWNYKTNT